MKQIKALLVGAGQRGSEVYGKYALDYPNKFKIIAVAEPIEERKLYFAKEHNLEPQYCFDSYDDLLKANIKADCVLICNQDKDHKKPTISFLEKGYDVLCEKPFANKIDDLLEMQEVAHKTKRNLVVCHVLRYTPYFLKLKSIIENNTIGDIVNIQHRESVGYGHMVHSFVRGNWNNSDETSPMILAKCCHDFDILSFLIESKCVSVSSMGSLSFFKESNAPKGSPKFCIEGCPSETTCPFNAVRYYTDENNEVFRKVIALDTSKENIEKALKEGPYGRCVFKCDNNVVDHQVVNLEYENGATATLTMCGLTYSGERVTTIMGTKGEIKGNMEQNKIEIFDYVTRNKETIELSKTSSGHGGGDFSLMNDFVNLLQLKDKKFSLSNVDVSVESHVAALCAEYSRINKGVAMNPYDIINKEIKIFC